VTRVGIVDDDTVIARALGAAVSAEPDFTLVGLAESLEEGLALVAQPLDVLLVDLGLPDGDGLELLPRLRATPHGERCKVLVFSVFGDGRSVVRAIEQGADGYVLKGADGREAIGAIRTVLAGGAPISPAVAGHILSRVRGAAPPRRRESKQPGTFALTPREVGVLEQLAKGLSFKEVASAEGISYHTVTDHVKAIYRKLSVNSRGEAVFEALHHGLIDLGE
jgi:DNA-binding NarL/FixJ family response regulator